MTFGRLKEYNIKTIFLKKYTKYGGDTIPKPISKNQN